MTLKRKAPAKSDKPSPSKRQKLDPDSKHPCQLCTSTASEDIVTIKYKVTKSKQHAILTGHKKCIEIIPELDWIKGNDVAKICAANLPSYKTRFKLVRARVYSIFACDHTYIHSQKCSLCPEAHGAKVQCSSEKCLQSFHINCAEAGKDMVFDTDIDTYGLYPWVLLCARHNQQRLKSKSLPTPVSSEHAPSTRASQSPQPESPSPHRSGGQDNFTEETAIGSAPMLTPPRTNPATPYMSASPFGAFSPPSSPVILVDTPMTPATESHPLDGEMAGDAEIEEAVPQQTASLPQVVLTPEQIKVVSDFMFTDPAWDELIRETLARHAPSTSTLVSVQ